jgi:hypothetical protein
LIPTRGAKLGGEFSAAFGRVSVEVEERLIVDPD